MTPSPSIQQAVWQAADQLMGQGIRPTVANVREITQRGSAGTINDALKAWWQDLSQRMSSRMPQPDVPEPIIALTKELWGLALTQGEQAYESYKQEAEQRVITAQEARAAAEDSQHQLQQLLQQTQAQLEHLQGTEKQLLTQLASESALRTQVESQLSQLKDHSQKTIAELETTRTQLEKEMALLVAQYQHTEQQARQHADALQRQLEQQEQLYRQQEQARDRAFRASEDRATQAELHLLRSQTELSLLQQRVEHLQQENTALKVDAQRQPTRRESFRAKLKRF